MARDPYEYFRIEAREIVDGLGRGVLALEKEGSAEQVAGILRLAHTLKGAARVVKQPGIAESAHAIEERLADARDGRAIDRPRIDALLGLIDAIAAGVRALDLPPAAAPKSAGGPPAEAGSPGGAVVSVARPVAGASPLAPGDELRAPRAEASELDGVIEGVGEAGQQVRALGRRLAGLNEAHRRAALIAERVAHAGAESARVREVSPAAAALARLRPVAEELRELLAGLDRQLGDAVEQTERGLREVRDAAEKLRLVTVSTSFVALERTARDAGRSLNREVAFDATGGDIRLESSVLATVQGALVQLVRNAVAHGIEPAEERRRAGKSPAGRIEIAAVRRGGRVTFSCRDDGRGIDREAVLRAARQKGLPSTGVATGAATDAATDVELLALLMTGGLTTSGAVTEVAGRGIGLDVVRAASALLGGEVTMTTAPGLGTTFELSVPVTLSALDALLVEADGLAAAIPLGAVRRTVRLAPGDVVRAASGDAIVDDGRVIPFAALARLLGRGSVATLPRAAVVVNGGHGLAALGVDRLLGTANVVVRPLPATAPAEALVAGATLDAEGTPQLVLDPAALVAAVGRDAAGPASASPQRPSPILVIDDSLTTRTLEQSILESAGYDVALATSAEEGIEMARQRRYALFLVDVEMPGMDGFTFVATTRADPTLRETPAILVTSRNAPEDQERGRQAGASGYVVKGDFDQAELLALIGRLVR